MRLLPILAASAAAVVLAGTALANEPYRPFVPYGQATAGPSIQLDATARRLHDSLEREQRARRHFEQDQRAFDLERRLDALEFERDHQLRRRY